MSRILLLITVSLAVLCISVAGARPFRWTAKNPPTVNGMLPAGESSGAFCKRWKVKVTLNDAGDPETFVLGDSKISWTDGQITSISGPRLQTGGQTLVTYGLSRDQVLKALGVPTFTDLNGTSNYRVGRYEYQIGFKQDRCNWLNVSWHEMTPAQFDSLWAGGSQSSSPLTAKEIKLDGISFGWSRKSVLAKMGKPNGPMTGPRVDSFGVAPATVVAYSNRKIVNYLYGQVLEVRGAKVRAGDPVSTLAKALGTVPSKGIWEFADGMLNIRADRLGHIQGFTLVPFLR